MLLDFGSMRLHICGKGNLFMVEVISGPNVLWQLYRPPGITRAFRQKGHTGHREHKTLGHFTFWNKQERFMANTQYAGHVDHAGHTGHVGSQMDHSYLELCLLG